MRKVPNLDLINYLIERKFSNTGIETPSIDQRGIVSTGPMPFSSETEVESYRNEIEEFAKELLSQSRAELKRRVIEDQAQRVAEAKAATERAEQSRFFNQPNADADYAYWCKAAGWTIDEATALVLGKEPDLVKREFVEEHESYSRFAKQYMRLYRLASRAKEMGDLPEPTQPSEFLAWAKRTKIDYPPELEVQVKAHDKASQRAQANTESFLLRERPSVLLLINAMAKQSYKFDPNEKRNTATAKISSDLELEGTRLNKQTVLHWLREAHIYSEEHKQS